MRSYLVSLHPLGILILKTFISLLTSTLIVLKAIQEVNRATDGNVSLKKV